MVPVAAVSILFASNSLRPNSFKNFLVPSHPLDPVTRFSKQLPEAM